ncbi:hypothetical protein SYNPS1DRAFT_31356 [Syncephalis pseudoplumigaleata]|uniref:DNA mismatch repair proteins mutS family domain-containing protein n=1 Tax=Syncephalis pseudoplumigaleata TaxID=1712513 RepID=A0A4P9YST3_9FUNG|nr:hypothetical protein SYNPS1DRAFT_31356 [Syncephalis pseudoplumigaleata]|eukprot:RKP22956.1 hypothetical protein SYNPS1DRAFT_31356 [Syncephalis pseudoplumigaleata]
MPVQIGKERAGTIYASLHHAALSATKSIGSVVYKAFMQKCLQHFVKKMKELLEPSYLQQLDARAHNAEADLFAIAASMDVQLGIEEYGAGLSFMLNKKRSEFDVVSDAPIETCGELILLPLHGASKKFHYTSLLIVRAASGIADTCERMANQLLMPLLTYIRSKQPQLHALIQAISLLDMIACFARNAVNTHQGASAFVHQLQEMKFLLHSLDGRSLILLDEMERSSGRDGTYAIRRVTHVS